MIRQAVESDAGAIAGIIDAAYTPYVSTIGSTPRPMLDDHAARIARGENFVLEDEAGTPIGVIALEPMENALHIFNIALRPEVHGRGLLRPLLAFAEDLARQRRLPTLTLFTHALMERNRAIYRHLGFTETHIEEGAGYRIVHMQRPLDREG